MENEMLQKDTFDAIREISDGIIAIRQGYKWGLVDSANHELMPIIYDYISQEDGKLWARYRGEKFYIPLDWLPLKYDCIYGFGEYNWSKVVKKGKIGTIDKDFKEIIPCQYDYFFEKQNVIQAGRKINDDIENDIYSYDGKKLLESIYFPAFIGSIIGKKDDKGMKYGLIDENYNVLIPCENASIKLVDQYKYRNYYDIKQVGGYHFLWKKGKGLIDIGYEKIKKTATSLLFCSRKQSYPIYANHANCIMRNIAYATNINGLSANREYIDVYSEDKLLISYCPDEIMLYNSTKNGLFICQSKENGKYGLVSEAGYKTPFIYDEIRIDNKKIIVATRDARYAFVEYNASYDYSTGQPIVKTNKVLKKGIVDIYDYDGNIIKQGIDFEKFDANSTEFIEGYLRLHIDKGIAVFKDSKQIIKENTYDEIGSFIKHEWHYSKSEYYDTGYSIVKKNGNAGAVNCEGRLIVPLIYQQIELLKLFNYRGGKQSSSILIARNEDKLAFYKADKSLQKLEYSFILTESTDDGCYIVSKDKIPMKYKSIGDLRSFEIWGDKFDCSKIIEVTDEETGKTYFEKDPQYPNAHNHLFGKIDQYGNEVVPCEFSITEIIKKTVSIKPQNKEYITLEEYEDIKIVRDSESKKVGILDRENNTLCDFIYETIYSFNDNGIAIVSLGKGKDGIINKDGTLLVPCEYDIHFSNSYGMSGKYNGTTFYIVQHEGKYGMIDEQGNHIIKCVHEELSIDQVLFQYGFVTAIRIYKDETGAINRNKNTKGIIDICHPDLYLLEREYDSIELNNKYLLEKENVIIAKAEHRRTAVNTNTKEILFDIYDACLRDVKILRKDIAVVKYKQDENEVHRFFSINRNCFVEGYSYEDIGHAGEHHVQVRKNDKWGLFNIDTYVEDIPCDYFEGATPHLEFMFYSNSEYAAVKKDGLYGYIDKHNQLVIDYSFHYAESFSDGRAIVKTSGMIGDYPDEGIWGVIDSKGVLLSDGYQKLLPFREGLSAAYKNGKWGFIDKEGKIAIPFRFTKARSFSDGLAAVAFKIRYGYIDKHNKTVIPFKYIDAFEFREGHANVYTSNDGYGVISKDGVVVEWTNKEQHDSYDDYDDTDYMRDSWDAMTDGMYGDMPDGFDGDYDFLGY